MTSKDLQRGSSSNVARYARTGSHALRVFIVQNGGNVTPAQARRLEGMIAQYGDDKVAEAVRVAAERGKAGHIGYIKAVVENGVLLDIEDDEEPSPIHREKMREAQVHEANRNRSRIPDNVLARLAQLSDSTLRELLCEGKDEIATYIEWELEWREVHGRHREPDPSWWRRLPVAQVDGRQFWTMDEYYAYLDE